MKLDHRDNYSDPRFGGDSYGSNTTRGEGNTNAGPHESRTANKMDPRVDSDQGMLAFLPHSKYPSLKIETNIL
jgi:hypothetical protein